VKFSDVAGMAPEERRQRRVRDLATPLDEHHSLDAGEMATTALRRLGGVGDEPVAVVRNGRIVGLVRAGDILRWTLVHPVEEP
jgi:hypothetical protein